MSKSPSLRRIQADVRELSVDPSDQYHAAPLEDDMFEWHFTIRGPAETPFFNGVYHGRIILPPEYPFKPPSIMFLTQSGRFEINTKVCLSFTSFHPELWQPAWGIRLMLEALISFLPTKADGAIGSLDYTSEERKKLAIKSNGFFCNRCGLVKDSLPPLGSCIPTNKNKKINRFEGELQKLHDLHMMHEGAVEHKEESTEPSVPNLKDPKVCALVVDENSKTGVSSQISPLAARSSEPVCDERISTDNKKCGVELSDACAQDKSDTLTTENKVRSVEILSGSEVNQIQIDDANQPKLNLDTGPDIASIESPEQSLNVIEVADSPDEVLVETEMNDLNNTDNFVIQPPTSTGLLFTDSMVHAMIAISAVIVIMLHQKVNDLLGELAALESAD